MKKLLFLLVILAPLYLLAADVPPVEVPPNPPGPEINPTVTIWQAFIPILVPLLLAGLKWVAPRVPKQVIPFIAPVLGAAIDLLMNVLKLGDGNGGLGAALGALGIGIREIFDKGVTKNLFPKAVPIAFLCLLVGGGCASQRVEKIDKDGHRTTYKTTAFFNKTAFVGVTVDKTTKTTSNLLSVGSYGAEAQGQAILDFLTGLQGLFEAGVKAGALKAVVPIP